MEPKKMISRSESFRSDRFSRSSAAAYNLGDFMSPIKAIIFRIKDISNNPQPAYQDETVDPTSLFRTEVKREQITIGRKNMIFRRIYLLGDSNYKVGWVVDIDIPQCMNCGSNFGWTRYRHHCRACGNLVCHSCSPYKAPIPYLSESGGSRVCKNCFTLKSEIFSAPPRHLGSVPDEFSPAVSPVKSPKRDSLSASPFGSPSPAASVSVSRSLPEDEDILQNCHRRMRELIPADIMRSNVAQMLSRGLPHDIAARIWSLKSLWLICMHPDDISKIMLGDLRKKYQAYSLDIVEMRAVWFVLRRVDWLGGPASTMSPVNASNSKEKAEWTLGFKAKLDDMSQREAVGALSPSEKRNIAYQGHDSVVVYDPLVEILPRQHLRIDRLSMSSSHTSSMMADLPPPAPSDRDPSLFQDDAGSSSSGWIKSAAIAAPHTAAAKPASKPNLHVSASFSSQASSDSTGFGSKRVRAPPTPSRLVGIFLAYVAGGEASKAKALITDSGCPKISATEASILLVRCADNPDRLVEPLATIALLVEELGADVNAEDGAGKSLIQHMFTDEEIGKYLMAHGADCLGGQSYSSCALFMSFEYGIEWMLEHFMSSGEERRLFESGDKQRLLRYALCLLLGGYYDKASSVLSFADIQLESDTAVEMIGACEGNMENLKQPSETMAFLRSMRK